MWAKLVEHSAKQQVLHQSVRLRCATQSGNQTVIARVLSTQAAAQNRHSDHTSSEPSAQLGSKSCVSQQCHPEWRPNGNCQHAVKASACPDQTSSTKWIRRAAGQRLLYQPVTVAPPRVATKQNRASVRPRHAPQIFCTAELQQYRFANGRMTRCARGYSHSLVALAPAVTFQRTGHFVAWLQAFQLCSWANPTPGVCQGLGGSGAVCALSTTVFPGMTPREPDPEPFGGSVTRRAVSDHSLAKPFTTVCLAINGLYTRPVFQT